MAKKPEPEESKKSNVRVCHTCHGHGVVEQLTRTKVGKRIIETTREVKCPADCKGGVINLRTI